MITKEFIIKYFELGIKNKSNCGIGIEHENLFFQMEKESIINQF